jgi:hypothetical protein
MTPEKIERNFEACGMTPHPDLTKLVMALCEDAACEERERCAKIAEAFCGPVGYRDSDAIASAIRKGEQA